MFIFTLALTACGNQQAAPSENSAPVVSDFSASSIIAEGHIKPARAVNLSFQVRGMVEDVAVEIGDRVTEGDMLARLSTASQAESQLAEANLELLQAQQAYDALLRNETQSRANAWTEYMNAQLARAEAQQEWDETNPRDIQNRVDDQQATVNDRKTDLEDAQEEFDKYKELDIDNSRRVAAEDDLRSARKDYDDAVAELEDIQRESDGVRAALDAAIGREAEAKYNYEQSLDGPNKEQLDLTTARLENARAQIAAAESALNNYIIYAPFDGVVADVAVTIGEQVGTDQRAVSIIDDSSWVVETSDVTELEVVDIQPGQPVTFVADALPDVTMDGVVTAVSQSSFTQSGDVLYTVYIKASDVDERVKWGMTVEVEFGP